MQECLQKYYELKLKEIEEIGHTIDKAFFEKLDGLERAILGDSTPANSVKEGGCGGANL